MPCYHPNPVLFKPDEKLEWLGKDLRKSESPEKAQAAERFLNTPSNRAKYSNHKYMELPCGQCIGCRLDRAKQWTIRNIVELAQHEESCWITLTYDEQSKQSDSLRYEDFKTFIKALRRKFKNTHRIRYYMAGEYGELRYRPHFHICLYGWQPPMKFPTTKSHAGFPQFESPTLTRLWKKGMVTVGDLNAETIAYTARYITTKVNGSQAEAHYKTNSIDKDTGEILSQLEPEFNRMSLKPGIGGEYYKQNIHQLINDDSIFANRKWQKLPRYFDRLTKGSHPEVFEQIRQLREASALERQKKNPLELSAARLAVKEKVQQVRLDKLKRQLD